MRSKTVVNNSFDILSLVNISGKVLYASASSEAILGYLPEELKGRNTLDLIHPEDRASVRRALRSARAKPVPRLVEIRVRHGDGSWCWMESTISNLLHEPQIGVLIVNCRDIRSQKEAREEEQQRLTALARYNEQLEDCTYAVAHDFRDPLRTISIFAELLVRDAQLNAKQKLLAQQIVDGAARMAALFEGLQALAISRVEHPSSPFNLGQAVDGALQDLGHAIAASCAIVTVDPMPMVQGNEIQVRRVFQNLLGNAIKYRSEDRIAIQVKTERCGPDWIVKVIDNGLGISPEYQQSIFKLLKRLHGSEIPGAGIGLAICKKIIEEMGGAIWVESNPGSGSVFCFTIAAAKDVSADNSLGAGALAGVPQGVSFPFRQMARVNEALKQAVSGK